jgi:surface antigen
MRAALRPFLLSAMLAAVLLLAMPAGTQAVGLNPFGPSGLPLNNRDYKDMAAAAAPLLNDDTIPLGTSRSWGNPSTGNSGTVTLLQRFEYDYEGAKLPCRKLHYHVIIRNYSDPYNIDISRCRVADGSWKLL